MTDIQHIDVDSEEFDGTPKALRDHVKKLQKQLDAVVAERDGFRTQLTEQSLGSVLTDAGYKNPKRVQRDLLADGVDPLDSEAVKTWLETNGEDYARGSVEQASTPTPTEDEQVEFQIPDYRRLNAPAEIGTPTSPDKAQAVLNAPPNATPAEMLAYLNGLGI